MTGLRPMRAVAVLALLAVAACGHHSGGSNDVAQTQPPPSSAAASTSPPASASASPTPSPFATVPTAERCHTSELKVSFRTAEGAAGSAYTTWRLTNISHRTCKTRGYPGVSLRGQHDNALGAPARREPGQPTPLLVLLPKASAEFVVRTATSTGAFPPGSCSGKSAAMRVYPPDETASLTVQVELYNCAGDFFVRPLQPPQK